MSAIGGERQCFTVNLEALRGAVRRDARRG